MVHEHVHNVLEQVGLFRGKEATAQLLDDLPKLGNSVIVLLRVVPAGKSCGQRPERESWLLLQKKSWKSQAVWSALPTAAIGVPSLEALSLLCSAFYPHYMDEEIEAWRGQIRSVKAKAQTKCSPSHTPLSPN